MKFHLQVTRVAAQLEVTFEIDRGLTTHHQARIAESEAAEWRSTVEAIAAAPDQAADIATVALGLRQ